MNNSSIYEKIENKGANDAKEIIRIGQKRAQEMKESTLKEINQETEQMISKANKNSEDKLKTRTTQIEQQAKQRSLLKKKQIISATFETALEQLIGLNDEAYKNLITKLLLADNLTGSEIIKVSKEDFNRFLRVFSSGKKVDNYYIIDKINKENYQLKLSLETLDINGGFVVIGDNYDINHSYQTIIKNAQEYYETKVAKILFDGE